MPNVMGVLRAEIRRLARKETRQEVAALRKHVNSMRRRLAESRRRIQDLETRAKHAGRRSQGAAAESREGDAKQVRFSPAWVKRHRSKLGMSRRVYAKLLSVSPQTIMGWETGRTRPRRGALRTWRSIRGKGIRELRALVAGGATKQRREGVAKRARRKLRAVPRRKVRAASRRKLRATPRRKLRAAPRRKVRAAPRRKVRTAPRRGKIARRGRRPRAKKK